MSPLVAGMEAAKSWHGCRRCVSPWVAFDYASCDAAAGPHPQPLSQKKERGEGGAGPMASAQLSQYAALPIRYGQPPHKCGDRQSFELTRRFPKRYDLGEPPSKVRIPSRVPFVTASLRTIRFVTRLDKDASSRVGSF